MDLLFIFIEAFTYIIAGTFESRKEGRSKEEKGVMTSEKWIGRSEESMKIV